MSINTPITSESNNVKYYTVNNTVKYPYIGYVNPKTKSQLMPCSFRKTPTSPWMPCSFKEISTSQKNNEVVIGFHRSIKF